MKNVMIVRRRKLGRTSCREIAAQSKHNTVVWRNDQKLAMENPDLVIRWGCTSNVPCPKVLNTAAAIHEVNDKFEFRRALNNLGLCPKTWFGQWEFLQDMKYTLDRDEPRKVVVRPGKHAQGRNLHVCSNPEELAAACNQYPQHYVSELIDKVAEYRIFVVQGRVACVAQKTPGNPEDVAWNVAKGGRFDNVRWGDWPMEAVKVGVQAFNLTSLDFGGVDVMVDVEGKAYVLEINSAPSLTSPYRQSCMAKCFDSIVDHGKERMPHDPTMGWKGMVHPAVSDKAVQYEVVRAA